MFAGHALCALLSFTAADHFEVPDDGSMVELRHDVDVNKQSDDVATLKVVRSFRNLGPSPQTLRFVVTLNRAAVVGLSCLTGPARIDWIAPDAAGLTLSNVPSGATRTVTLTLKALLDRKEGRAVLNYPGPDPQAVPLVPVVRAGSQVLGAKVGTAGQRAYPLGPTFVPAKGRVRHSGLSLGQRTLWALQFDAPLHLSKAPKRAQVAFVVDTSVSQGAAGYARQIALMTQVAQTMPGALFDAVLTAQQALPIMGAFSSWTVLKEQLDARDFTAQNGSRLDLGLAVALQQAQSGAGPWRVLAFTDAFLSPQVDFTALPQPQDPPERDGALNIVVLPSARTSTRGAFPDDSPALAQLAQSHGGILLRMQKDAKTRTIAAQLSHPHQLDDVHAYADALPVDLPWGTNVQQGGRLRFVDVRAGLPEQVQVRGQVWSHAMAFPGRAAPQMDKQIALEALTGDLQKVLTDAELLQLAHRAGAVTRLTSRVAGRKKTVKAGSGAQPTYAWRGLAGVYANRFSPRHPNEPFAYKEVSLDVQKAVKSCAPRRGKRRERVRIVVETTGSEIVAVKARGARRADVNACVAKAIWALRLDPRVFTALRGITEGEVRLR